MDAYMIKQGKKMKVGYTTGSCATAAAAACTHMLLTKERVFDATIKLPKGDDLKLTIEDVVFGDNYVMGAVQKDAGDDPDVTHGAYIYAKVKILDRNHCEGDEAIKVVIKGGVGVGRVTTDGMRRPKGEWAINPVPLKMIRENVTMIASKQGFKGTIEVEISVPKGLELAKRTYNPRLGIQGGISILGTSGLVEPMSEKALIATIHLDIERLISLGKDTIILSPGNYGQEYCKDELGLDLEDSVKTSNYIGESLDYCSYKGIKKLLLIGHTGKIIKLAAGIMNTHSSYGDARMEIIAAHAALFGANAEIIKQLLSCVTTDQALDLLYEMPYYEAVKKSIIERIKYHLEFRLKEGCEQIEFCMFTTQRKHIFKSQGFDSLVDELKEG